MLPRKPRALSPRSRPAKRAEDGLAGKKMMPNDYRKYCGPSDPEENSHSGVVCSRRGQKTIIAVATEHLTDEDIEATSKVTRIIADSFIRRPSMEERAIRQICGFANDGLSMHQADPSGHVLCDAGILLLLRQQARWIVTGKSRVFHFENGKLARQSDPEDLPPFGSGPALGLSVSPSFTVTAEENAFLVCSGALADSVSAEQMEEDLNASRSPSEWMDKLIGRASCQSRSGVSPSGRSLPQPPFWRWFYG